MRNALRSLFFFILLGVSACEEKTPVAADLAKAKKRIHELESEVSELKRIASAASKPHASASFPPTGPMQIEAKPPVSLTLSAFWSEYHANKAAFYSKYAGVPLRVTGPILQIEAKFLRLRAQHDRVYLDCFFARTMTRQLESLRYGQVVTVQGLVTQQNEPFNVQMENCIVP